MKAEEICRQKLVLPHKTGERLAIYEIVIWKVPATKDYPTGVKYRAWVSENGKTLFGFDNHNQKVLTFTLEALKSDMSIAVWMHFAKTSLP